MGANQDELGGQVGANLASFVERSGAARPFGSYLEFLNKHPGRAALLAGGLGAGVGVAAAKLKGQDPQRLGLLGGAAGTSAAALASYLMHRNNKQASFYGGQADSLGFVQSAVSRDPHITYQTKSEIIPALERLDPAQLAELAGMLRVFAGASVGALVGRFLMRLGVFGSGVMGVLGGLVGGGMLGPQRNSIGQLMDRSGVF